MDELLHHFDAMVETISFVAIGSGVVQDFVHPQYVHDVLHSFQASFLNKNNKHR